ncbi:hypothetical protein OGAPHI_004705 [Ogataea philodendri]|uniref:Zn(2)-C6 fungal-type domain-containing protein n=1 Tax=Ogataea philodendri TaxID=1378263 RepID=A0A9P8T2T0_9ASCO|nr:uncharacterized protein OGAPHI_004705 [Ogataea philodendri]KAH3663991.1 hypothetical protein OGAPHI_004705 [Ogataea philodendri]
MDKLSSSTIKSGSHPQATSPLVPNPITLPPIRNPTFAPLQKSHGSDYSSVVKPQLPKLTPAPDFKDPQELTPTRVPRSLPDQEKQPSRSHKVSKRSRKGCLTCRFRKRKCCETKPICTECKRLGIKCSWITNGLENKNKCKRNPDFLRNDECYDDLFGVIKVIRGKIDYKIDNGEFVEGNRPSDDELYTAESKTNAT